MVWPFSRNKNGSNNDDTLNSNTEKQQLSQTFLEDLPPKFSEEGPNNEPPQGGLPSASGTNGEQQSGTKEKIEIPGLGEYDPNKSKVSQAFSTVQLSDFSKVNEIPCFRKAMMTGGAVGAIAFAVLITTRSPMKRAMNWTVLGFTIGSIGTWEQCRFKIRKERRNQEMAREVYKKREAPGGPASSSIGSEPNDSTK